MKKLFVLGMMLLATTAMAESKKIHIGDCTEQDRILDEIAQTELSSQGVIDLVHSSAAACSIEILSAAMQKYNVAVDLPFPYRCETPLHSAVSSNNLETARYLLAQGANPNPVDCDGNSLLILFSAVEASQYTDDPSMVSLLLSHKTRISDHNKHFSSALDFSQQLIGDSQKSAITQTLSSAK